MDELTRRIKLLSEGIIQEINKANLPPIVVDLILSDILREVKDAEDIFEDEQKKEVEEMRKKNEVSCD